MSSHCRKTVSAGLQRLVLALATCFSVAYLVWVSAFATPACAAERRNLVIIHVDEFHYGMLGCYGGKIVGTPNIDWLAEHGAICTSFYATTPVCSPSRASFVSGRYPQNTPVVTNNIPLDDNIITFAHVLAEHGYATGYAGKWHLDGKGKPQWAPERKFGFDDNRFMFNRGHWKKMEDTPSGPRVAARNRRGQPSYDVAGADEKSFTTDWLASKAIDFIEQHKDAPFCYMVSFPDPHGPNTVRAPYDTMYQSVEVPIPVSLHPAAEQIPAWGRPQKNVGEESLRRIMPPYYGMVKCIDENVGKILATLRRNGLLENTAVVFTADHGDLCGEHGRLNKGVPFEGSAKIPFVIYFPGKVPAGLVVPQALGTVDFAPTILALLELPVPPVMEGRDASRLLMGKQPADWDEVTFVRSTPGHSWLAAVTDRYTLVYSQADRPWLYDLEDDPHELLNRFDDPKYRPVVRRLTEALVDYCRRYQDPYGQDEKIRRDMLNALGGR